MGFFASWLTSPMMLGAGALAIASPILIHLLNKRRFKIVRWAAMDFLLDANKKNRRRVQLENFIILALRCLAMLLIGLLLARPFLPNALVDILKNTKRFERIVVLDDSPSMLTNQEGGSPWNSSMDGLKQLVKQMAQNQTDDSLTLILASRPQSPLISSRAVNTETLDSILLEVDSLRSSDVNANLRAAFGYVASYLRNDVTGLNRLVYVLSDRRESDWEDGSDGQDAQSASGRLRDISKLAAGCFFIDVPVTNTNNLSVVATRQSDQWVAGSVARLEVDIKNWGDQVARDVKVELRIGQALPIVETIEELAAGELKTVVFQHGFENRASEKDAGLLGGDQATSTWDAKLQIDVTVKTASLDGLKEDSKHFYVGRVLNHIPILLVDGDPSSSVVRSETFPLTPLAGKETGIAVDIVTAGELETVSLSKYKIIFLCNVDLVSEDRLKALEKWTADGGNLVFFPGNRVKSSDFNQLFHKDGKGLCPVRLTEMLGDPSRQTSAKFAPDPQPHPFLQVLLEADKGIFSRTNIFSWWGSVLSEKVPPTAVSVPMRLEDEVQTPAIVDYHYGRGRTVYFCMASDTDWTDWPNHESYIVVMIIMVRDLVSDSMEFPNSDVGQDFVQTVDLSRFKPAVLLESPGGEQTETVALPIGSKDQANPAKQDPGNSEKTEEPKGSSNSNPASDSSAEQSSSTVFYEAVFRSLKQKGFYQVKLQSNTSKDVLLQHHACNIQASESNLKVVSQNKLERWFGDSVQWVPISNMTEQSVASSRDEFWFQILMTLAAVLGLEQFLAFWFGTRR